MKNTNLPTIIELVEQALHQMLVEFPEWASASGEEYQQQTGKPITAQRCIATVIVQIVLRQLDIEPEDLEDHGDE